MINHRHKIKTTRDFHSQRAGEGKNVSIINLGCARNLVDSQTILTNLKKNGHRISELNESQVAIVNTCAFIDEAKKESIDTILEMLELKKQGKIKKVIVAGCLAQRYSKELINEFKGIDAIVGAQKLDNHSIPSDVSLTPQHYAYVKISESCFNQCSFCIIPKLKGKFVSRTIESVLEEIKRLDANGTREVNIIGQDITAYGMDLYRQFSLAKLLKAIVPVTKDIKWFRLLYAFPAHVTDELIETIASEEKICKYIDMPLQHISDPLLKSMNRNITTQGTYTLVDKIRKRIPHSSLRTTFIVGLPGETEEDFRQLLEFVRYARFEKMGAFVYSREEGTSAYAMPNQIPDAIKRQRLKELMKVQQSISQDIQKQFIDKKLMVIIDEKVKEQDNEYLGRTSFDAPEVDGVVFVKSPRTLSPGDIVDVHIHDTYEYDLAGEVL